MESAQSRVAIITGGSKGIGKAIATKLANEGIKLVLVARNKSPLKETVEHLLNFTDVIGISADISQDEDINKILEETLSKFGRVDILVNNAGMYLEKPFGECTTEEIDKIIGVDLRGMFLLTRNVIPHLKAQKSGMIINIASEMGLNGVENQALHCACKFAIVGFSQSLFHEMRRHNILVSYLCPNATNTWGDEKPDSLLSPEDVADVVHFILSSNPNNAIAQIVFRSLKPYPVD